MEGYSYVTPTSSSQENLLMNFSDSAAELKNFTSLYSAHLPEIESHEEYMASHENLLSELKHSANNYHSDSNDVSEHVTEEEVMASGNGDSDQKDFFAKYFWNERKKLLFFILLKKTLPLCFFEKSFFI